MFYPAYDNGPSTQSSDILSLSFLTSKGFDANDNGLEALGLYEGEAQNDVILSKLTNKQRKVASYLNDGYKRKEVAKKLGVCIQAVHQIVLRIRKRLQIKKAIDYDKFFISKRERLLKNLTYFYCLSSNCFEAEKIFITWEVHPVLKDYECPGIELISAWVQEFIQELTVT